MNPRSTDWEADALTTTPSPRPGVQSPCRVIPKDFKKQSFLYKQQNIFQGVRAKVGSNTAVMPFFKGSPRLYQKSRITNFPCSDSARFFNVLLSSSSTFPYFVNDIVICVAYYLSIFTSFLLRHIHVTTYFLAFSITFFAEVCTIRQALFLI